MGGLDFLLGMVSMTALGMLMYWYQMRAYYTWQDETCECTCEGCSCHLFERRQNNGDVA